MSISPPPLRDSFYSFEAPKTFSATWTLWFQNIWVLIQQFLAIGKLNGLLKSTASGTVSVAVNGVDYLSQSSTSLTATTGAATLPANPVGFVVVKIDDTDYKIPYYNL